MLLAPEHIGAVERATIGGKALGLLHIGECGLRTPPWRVLPFAVVAHRAWHGDAALRETLGALLADFGGTVAVRSSAVNEDGADSSQAGQFHTAFADSFEQMMHALDTVADAGGAAPMAIVLQQGLDPEFAGVAFSADPACARMDAFCVEAVPGHGCHLVDGAVTPERFVIGLDGCFAATEDPAAATFSVHANAFAHAMLLLEDSRAAAIDVEWAIAGGTFYFLQARPLTALAPDSALVPDACHTSWFFDQRFLQPISPFTRSTLVPLILRASIGAALAMRGEDPSQAKPHYHGGQAYLAHALWRRALAGAPWWFLSLDLRQLFPTRCGCGAARRGASMFGYAWDALCSVVRHRGEVFLNVPRWRAFEAALPGKINAALALKDFRAQWAALDALSEEFLALHRWSILWADYAYRVFRGIAAVLGARRAEAALHEGICFPTVAANAALERARASGAEEDWATVREVFGDRSESLDYAAPTWRELYAGGGPAAAGAGQAVAAVRHSLLGWLLGPVRRLLEMREAQRFAWEHVLAAQRRLAVSRAQHLGLGQADDVWLLELDELAAAIEGTPLPPAQLLAARRHACRIERLIPRPLFVGGEDAPGPRTAADAWQGTGASAGIARGIIVPVPDLSRGLPADCPRPCILVVRALDPAHTHLLRHAEGIIAERGGLLSHAAILAREYGVPLVTALEGALETLPPGAQVEIDGQRGSVSLLL